MGEAKRRQKAIEAVYEQGSEVMVWESCAKNVEQISFTIIYQDPQDFGVAYGEVEKVTDDQVLWKACVLHDWGQLCYDSGRASDILAARDAVMDHIEAETNFICALQCVTDTEHHQKILQLMDSKGVGTFG